MSLSEKQIVSEDRMHRQEILDYRKKAYEAVEKTLEGVIGKEKINVLKNRINELLIKCIENKGIELQETLEVEDFNSTVPLAFNKTRKDLKKISETETRKFTSGIEIEVKKSLLRKFSKAYVELFIAHFRLSLSK